MRHIPDGLQFKDLTTEQQRVLRYAYDRYQESITPRRLLRHKVGIFFFHPMSENQAIEHELFELGLLARTHANPLRDGVPYGYAISYDGAPFVETGAHR